MRRDVLVPALLEADLKLPLAFRQIQAAGLVDWRGQSGHAGYELLYEAVERLLGPARVNGVPEPEPEPESIAPTDIPAAEVDSTPSPSRLAA